MAVMSRLLGTPPGRWVLRRALASHAAQVRAVSDAQRALVTELLTASPIDRVAIAHAARKVRLSWPEGDGLSIYTQTLREALEHLENVARNSDDALDGARREYLLALLELRVAASVDADEILAWQRRR